MYYIVFMVKKLRCNGKNKIFMIYLFYLVDVKIMLINFVYYEVIDWFR